MAKGIYGEKVQTGKYPVHFNNLDAPDEKGNYQVEIVVPIEEARELNDKLYGDNDRLIEANKKTAKAKKPAPLFVKKKEYDQEAGEPVTDEDGEQVYSDTHVIFRAKTRWNPKVQFLKSIKESERTKKLGFGSEVALSINAYSSSTLDDSGNTVNYTLLSLNGVRIYSIVEASGNQENPFDEDENFEDDESGDFEDAKGSEDNEESKDF